MNAHFRNIVGTTLLSTFGAVALLVSTSGVASATAEECSSLLRECVAFATDGTGTDRRASCFQNAASDERCKQTALSRVAFLRGTLVSEQGTDQFAFLGPQFIDAQCVERFDNQISSELIRGSISDEAANALYVRLDQCRKESFDNMLRP